MRLIRFLNYPYPFYENTKQGFKISFSIGLFIAIFCYLFMPFGLDKLNSSGRLGYGLVSFLVCGLYIVILPLIFKNVLQNKGWKIYKEIIWILLINLSLAFANYFYTGYLFNAGYKFNFRIFLFVLTCTVIIAVIPAITIILYKQLFVYKKIVKEVAQLDSQIMAKNDSYNYVVPQKKLAITSENNKDIIEIKESDLMFIASAGNYIELYFLNDNTIEKKLLRNNISKVEQQLKKFKNIIRCHRSYIINLDKIEKVSGNLQGYQLSFKNMQEHIPVSRSYTKTIKTAILNA